MAPVSYYCCLAKFKEICIENHETYSRQSYRNRCSIYAANGILNLSIPVNATNNTVIKEVTIEHSENWQRQHWRSISSAYKSSPYFIYYDYELQPFYEKPFKYLIDFNEEIQNKFLTLLNLSVHPFSSLTYDKFVENSVDLRELIHPKKSNLFSLPQYNQVFIEKHGFIPNLSILDLLFNQGPESKEYLLSSFI
ncbi:MAG: WbqC family protein [Bacteroidetes bacterium]|nr:WbqC family protein [Bacteroidota bacterium]